MCRLPLRRLAGRREDRMTRSDSQTNSWELPDEKLLRECRVDSYVASGPGGQKRHKTNAAVRITHLPTKIVATATDSRSHRENQIHALRNLRHKLALEIRRDLDALEYRTPDFLAQYEGLRMNPK